MLRTKIKIFIFTLLLLNCASNVLSANATSNPRSNQPINTKFKLPLKNVTPEEDAFVTEFVKKIKNPRIVYKDGQVIFYPDPDVEQVQNQMIIMAVIMLICAITVILLPISLILLFVEVCCAINLSSKNDLKKSMTPYITLDDFGIKIKKQNTFWIDVSSLSKEEITKYQDGWVRSKEEKFHFYGKYLNSLFDLSSQDECIAKNFNNLISLIYHYLEKAEVEFTQNVQKTTISETTSYQPVYVYR